MRPGPPDALDPRGESPKENAPQKREHLIKRSKLNCV